MSLITFTSDYGTTDHYVAAVKAKILSSNPSQLIIDISHDIRPFDISHAATVLKYAFSEFPSGTVHLVAVDAVKEEAKAVLVELQGHFFLGFDSGLFSLIIDEAPDLVIELPKLPSTFLARDLLAPTAAKLAEGLAPRDLGTPLYSLKKLFGRQLKVTKREIAGNVISIDHFGNLITNINQVDFDKMLTLNGSAAQFTIRFGREHFRILHEDFTDVESGDCFVLFNSYGRLQIGINKGNASELLGLNIDAPVIVEFTN